MLDLRGETNYKTGLIDWIEKVKEILGRGPRIGVEVGTYSGDGANILSKYTKHLICVDAYEPFEQLSHGPGLRKARRLFLDKLKEELTNVSFLHMDSEDAANTLSGDFDFVYIDANHRYQWVKRDIRLWEGKCKVLGGHDYTDPGFTGVRAAVKELANGREIITFDDTSWMYVSK
jgi:hypothetical protein